MITLRLILGDQLSPCHSWFDCCDEDIIYVLMEVRQETDYVLHHAQKILAIFAAMRDLARQLREAGHRVHYLRIDDEDNRQKLTTNLDALILHYGARQIQYQAPDEWRLDQQLAEYARLQQVSVSMVDSEHFYTARHEVAQIFRERKQWLMEHFYRHMRSKHNVLMDGSGRPEGGQWNFDHDNRKAWSGLPPEPADPRQAHDHSLLWQSLQAAGVASFGNPQADALAWPLNRQEALDQTDAFVASTLPYFGDFQDALSSQHWRLFHSLLSFALNTKMITPAEVICRVEAAWRADLVPLSAAEGFIRQLLGWREYVRGIYWSHMPSYVEHNVFAHQQPLPAWFWTGQTRMSCLAQAIGQSLQHAYAHHIQRLMVIGNFALLAGLQPAAVHQWYLGVYIDAFEWVELPNTLGMSQFADGGLLATKPYVSSAAYIDRMSDHCKACHYDKKQRLGEHACPFNSLYWDFFARNRGRLGRNPRLGMVYRQLDKMDASSLQSLSKQASTIRIGIEQL